MLTAPWHERDAESLVERLGVPVYTPLPDTAQYLMDTYGITAEQAGDGSPDVVWLLRENKGEARPYTAGDRLPFGADVFPGHKPNDTVLWVESQRAVISGDTLVDFGRGLEINERWLRPGVTREEIAEGLAPAPRTAGRARACDARRADRPGRPRARVVLLLAGRSALELFCARDVRPEVVLGVDRDVPTRMPAAVAIWSSADTCSRYVDPLSSTT